MVAKTLDHITEALVRHNSDLLARRYYPPLYRSGVVYRPQGEDVWTDIEGILADGEADCKSLCAYRAAELRHRGEYARCFHLWQLGAKAWNERHPFLYHTLLARQNGQVEDPSAILGMQPIESS